MKLVTFRRNPGGKEEPGILLPDGRIMPASRWSSVNDIILHAGRESLEALAASDDGALDPGSVTLLSPIPEPLQDVLCLGLNYRAHADEAFQYSQDSFSSDRAVPIFFSKRVSRSQGTGDIIPAHEDLTSRLDYENELAVIIGKDAVNVSPEDAKQYIFGYTILNDVSARDLQTSHRQWYFGKSLDGFTPMGPCIITADEVSFPPALKISTRVNGELRQDSTTDMLIHSIPEIISFLSRGMTLKAGSIIATGTPKGVVMGMDDPVFLKKGDVIECFIEGIGTLVNTVG